MHGRVVKGQDIPPRILPKIGLVFIGLSVALIVSEIAFSALFRPDTRYYVFPPNLHRAFKPMPYAMPGIEGISRFITNSQGIRGDEFLADDAYEILTVGGSTTACVYLDQSECWPYLLQQKLNQDQHQHKVWVGSVGKSGLNTQHHVVQMKYLLNQYPNIDAVTVLVGINDFLVRLAKGENYDPHFLDRPGAEDELVSTIFARFPERKQRTLPWYKRTALWRVAKAIKTGKTLWHLERNLTHRENVEDEAGRWYVEERKKRRLAALKKDLPPLTSALEEYSRNINTLIQLARDRSIRIIFLTQPSMWKPGLSKESSNLCWMGASHYEKEYYSIEALATGMKMYNRTLLKVCKAQQIECLDLASLLPRDTSSFYDDAHFNERGAEKVAGILAHYMMQHAPFKKQVRKRPAFAFGDGR